MRSEGVKNIEMEVLPFAALTHHAGIKAAAVCCAFLDRLKGDQVNNKNSNMFYVKVNLTIGGIL